MNKPTNKHSIGRRKSKPKSNKFLINNLWKKVNARKEIWESFFEKFSGVDDGQSVSFVGSDWLTFLEKVNDKDKNCNNYYVNPRKECNVLSSTNLSIKYSLNNTMESLNAITDAQNEANIVTYTSQEYLPDEESSNLHLISNANILKKGYDQHDNYSVNPVNDCDTKWDSTSINASAKYFVNATEVQLTPEIECSSPSSACIHSSTHNLNGTELPNSIAVKQKEASVVAYTPQKHFSNCEFSGPITKEIMEEKTNGKENRKFCGLSHNKCEGEIVRESDIYKRKKSVRLNSTTTNSSIIYSLNATESLNAITDAQNEASVESNSKKCNKDRKKHQKVKQRKRLITDWDCELQFFHTYEDCLQKNFGSFSFPMLKRIKKDKSRIFDWESIMNAK